MLRTLQVGNHLL